MSGSIPETMRAVAITAPGGAEVLQEVRLPVPQPGAGEILIRVEAAGVNRSDVLQRRGVYPPPQGASPLPGLEVAGVVAALGAGAEATEWRPGMKVTALVSGGGYAEYVTAPAGQCLPVPQGLSQHEASALPEALFTLWFNLYQRGGLKAGESVLMHGGTSGLGSFAVQLIPALGGTLYVTAGSDEKCQSARAMGAAAAINYHTEDFVAAVLALTGGRGVDVVLDMVGGDYLERNLRALAEEGRHISIAVTGGAKASLDLALVMQKRLNLTGSTLRPRSPETKAGIAAAPRRTVWPLIETGRLCPQINAVFPLEQAAEAHRLMESSAHRGKIVLNVLPG